VHRVRRRVGIVTQPGIVDLDPSAPAALQFVRLLVHRHRHVHHQLVGVLVELVLGLLRHGEGTGQRDLGQAIGVAAEKLHVADLHRPLALHLADHARHADRTPCPVGNGRGMVVVDAVERLAKRLE
jgi:hypothetical protein